MTNDNGKPFPGTRSDTIVCIGTFALLMLGIIAFVYTR